MPIIELVPLKHKDALQIGIRFPFDAEVKAHLKKLEGVKWSQKHSSYYILLTSENKKELLLHLRKKGWNVDDKKLKQVHEEKFKKGEEIKSKIDKEGRRYLWEYVNFLRGKRYSESTVRTYYNFVIKFIAFQTKPIQDLNNRDVELFIEQEIAQKGYAISTHRQCVSALKHFAGLHQISDIEATGLQRPKKSKILPGVLSQEEIIDLLRATRNLKHRAILALLYSSGLRIGELLNLKLHHISIDRRQIRVHQGKGRKDRYVIMAESMLPLLCNYLNTYKPEIYFVEGSNGKVYSPTSVRTFLKISCKRAGIRKRVTPHTLRHSYATHMLENGIGLRHIQELLGHAKPETTMIYTHVAHKDLMQIKSPLDVAVNRIQRREKTDKEEENLRLSRDLLD